MGSSAEIRRTFHTQRADPERLWARYVPRAWPRASRLSLDLSAAGVRRRSRPEAEPAQIPDAAVLRTLDDLLWLPAVDTSERAIRDRWLAAASEVGVPALSVVEPEENLPAGLPVVDLFEILAAASWSPLADRASAEVAIWPLVAGWTDRPGVVEEGLQAVRDAGFRTVIGIRADLEPRELRELGERVQPEGYERLFHAPPADRRAFARAVAAAGLTPWLDRPLPAGPPHLRGNRRVGGLLLRLGELSQALGRPELEAQAYYRAARWVDDTPHDVEAMADEGNLGIVEPVEAAVQSVIEAYRRDGRSALLEQLEAKYLAEPSADESDDDGTP